MSRGASMAKRTPIGDSLVRLATHESRNKKGSHIKTTPWSIKYFTVRDDRSSNKLTSWSNRPLEFGPERP